MMVRQAQHEDSQLDLFERRKRNHAHSAGHRMHGNSLNAFRVITRTRKTRADVILAYVIKYGPCTDRDIMHGLHYSEMNMIRPRVTELIDDGKLVEFGSVRDKVSGVIVRMVKAIELSKRREEIEETLKELGK